MEEEKPQAKKIDPLIVIIVVFLLIGSLFSGVSRCNSGQSSVDKFDAYAAAQEFVKKSLKAPSTASFPTTNEATVTDLGNGQWRVQAWVDAQNSFGAMLRSNFECTIKFSDDDWYLEKLILDGKLIFKRQ